MASSEPRVKNRSAQKTLAFRRVWIPSRNAGVHHLQRRPSQRCDELCFLGVCHLAPALDLRARRLLRCVERTAEGGGPHGAIMSSDTVGFEAQPTCARPPPGVRRQASASGLRSESAGRTDVRFVNLFELSALTVFTAHGRAQAAGLRPPASRQRGSKAQKTPRSRRPHIARSDHLRAASRRNHRPIARSRGGMPFAPSCAWHCVWSGKKRRSSVPALTRTPRRSRNRARRSALENDRRSRRSGLRPRVFRDDGVIESGAGAGRGTRGSWSDRQDHQRSSSGAEEGQPQPEPTSTDFRNGVRGKYASRYWEVAASGGLVGKAFTK